MLKGASYLVIETNSDRRGCEFEAKIFVNLARIELIAHNNVKVNRRMRRNNFPTKFKIFLQEDVSVKNLKHEIGDTDKR